MTTNPDLDGLTVQFDRELVRFLSERRDNLGDAALLIDEMLRLVGAGGKRFRPSFCYWGYRAAGGDHCDEIVRGASSLEILHTFAIVHDDIMDVSDERRGLPTTFAKHGVNVALLVGDLALVLADAAFMSSGFSPDRLTDAFAAYSRMRQEVIAGQYLDIDAATKAVITVEEARRIAVLKSGRYSIEEPLAIGAALAGAPHDLREGLIRFGAPLGEAFQLRDDLLGTFGDRSSVGKPVDSDIREGKRHVLFAMTAEALTGAERDRFLGDWGRGAALDDGDVGRLRELVVSSGAKAKTETLLEELKARAASVLGELELPGEARSALEELAHRATYRDV